MKAGCAAADPELGKEIRPSETGDEAGIAVESDDSRMTLTREPTFNPRTQNFTKTKGHGLKAVPHG